MVQDPKSRQFSLPHQEATSPAAESMTETFNNEKELLYSAAIQTSRAILEVREQTQHELNQTKKALEEKTGELNRSLSLLRATIESTPDGLLVTDRKGKILCYNQLYLDMWAIPQELIEIADHRAILQYCGKLLKDAGYVAGADKISMTSPKTSLDVLQFKDGRIFERYTKVKVLDGRNMGRVWSFRDITERRQAETLTAQLAAIVESSYDAIIVKDLHGIITSWNAGAERIFGYRSSEIVGCSITTLIPPDRLGEESKVMSLIKSGKILDHFETVRWGKGKKPIDVSITVSPVRDGTGNIVGASKVARDITQRKESQERIQYLPITIR